MPTHTDAYSGISVTWSGGGNWTTGIDGRIIIQEGGSVVTVSHYDPPETVGADGKRRNGAVVGMPGSGEMYDYGYNYGPYFNPAGRRNSVPFDIPTNSCAIIVKSKYPDPNGVYYPTTQNVHYESRSRVEYEICICVVPWDPTSSDGPYFGPPAYGTNAISQLARSIPIPLDAIVTDRFPSIVDLTNPNLPSMTPSTFLANMTGYWEHFNGDKFSAWSSDTGTPAEQHVGYGRDLGNAIGASMAALSATNFTDAEKLPLARLMVQYGLDLAAAFADGKYGHSSGAHCCGRKSLMMLAGYLLGRDVLVNADGWLREPNQNQNWQLQYGPFRENGAFFKIPGGAWFNTTNNDAAQDWQIGWRKESSNFANTNDLLNGSQWSNPPNTWGDPNDYPNTWASQVAGYCWHATSACMLEAWFWKTLGLAGAYGVATVGFVEQWLAGPPAAALTELTNAGFSTVTQIPFGTSYNQSGGVVPNGLPEAIWSEYPPPATPLGDRT